MVFVELTAFDGYGMQAGLLVGDEYVIYKFEEAYMLVDGDKTGLILGACMEVHNELGNGFLEAVYQEALEEEFKLKKIPYKREQFLPVLYKGKVLNNNYYADFICFNKIIVELKAVGGLAKPHKAQVLNYLNAADLDIGLLVNFGETSLKWERISRFKNQ